MHLRIFLLLFPFICFGQSQFRFENFSIKNGLSQNTVNSILKDIEGFYWFGTQDGLNKYDGYSVKVFRHERSDSNSISDNFILNIIEDNHGNLWIGTRNGLNFFEKKTERFVKVIVSEKEKKDYHNRIWNLMKDKKGDIYFSNEYNQFVKIEDKDCEQPSFFPEIISEKTNLLNSSFESYFILKDNKIVLLKSDTHQKKWEINDSLAHYPRAFLETKEGEVLLGTGKGLFLIPKNKNEKIKNILDEKIVTNLFSDSKKNIWVATVEGIYFFRNGDLNNLPVFLSHSTENSHSLGSNNIQGIYEDPDGLIWIGTSEAGVNIYNPNKNFFNLFNHNSDIPLSGNSVWSIYQDKNELWVGTNSGLNHFILENETVCGIYDEKNKVRSREIFSRTPFFPNSIISNMITCITKDKKGNFWFGSHSGISVYNSSLKQWNKITTENSPLKTNVIFHLMCASDGKIWISTMNSFYSYDPNSKKFNSFLSTYEGGIFPTGYIISTYEDKDGSIWAASTGGIYHIKNNGDKIAFFFSEPENSKSLSYNMATAFLRDSQGRFWITTLGGGINLLDEKTNTFRAFTIKDGLANDIVYCIAEDKKMNLWVSTNSGFCRFDPKNSFFINYTEKDGLGSNEFCQNSVFTNNSGEMFFGSTDGFIAFDPDLFEAGHREVPILLSSLTVNYNSVPCFGINQINLNYDHKAISFEFTSPDFQNQEKIHYSFQLQEFDKEWNDLQSSTRVANYTNLPFGEYVFKVRQKTGNADWQKKILSINVNVIPPFWLRKWFITLEILAGLILIIFLVRYFSQRKLRHHLREIKVQQRIHQEKERISRDLHDNVGSNLTYITNSLDNLSYKIKPETVDLSQEKITALSDYTRSTMEQLRETIWAINKETVSMEEFTGKIREYGNRMSISSKINFKMEFPGSSNSILNPALAINLFRIIQESINNCVKHSKGDILLICITENENRKLYVAISDNGQGIKKENLNIGYGLKNMNDRVNDMKGKLKIDSLEGHGTKIEITVPI